MGELSLAYEARSYTTGIVGRSICNARNHHFVAENSGGEAVGAGELFCASIAACAVNMVTTIANSENRALGRMEVSVGAYRASRFKQYTFKQDIKVLYLIELCIDTNYFF